MKKPAQIEVLTARSGKVRSDLTVAKRAAKSNESTNSPSYKYVSAAGPIATMKPVVVNMPVPIMLEITIDEAGIRVSSRRPESRSAGGISGYRLIDSGRRTIRRILSHRGPELKGVIDQRATRITRSPGRSKLKGCRVVAVSLSTYRRLAA